MSAFSFDDIPDQSGRTALVTGANTGIGFHIAKELARAGARVLLACRDRNRAQAAMADIQADVPAADLAFIELDLADLASVRAAADTAREEARLDLLIENAGVMMPPFSTATAGCELQFAVNHLGHFALAGLLLDKLAQTEGSRIVVQSSLAHRRGDIAFGNLDGDFGYDKSEFYGQSKFANLLFAFELDRRLRAEGSPVTVVACHPGIAETELTRHLPGGAVFGRIVGAALNDARRGALPALQAATDPAAAGGDYYGPWGFMEMSGSTSGRAFATARSRDPVIAKKLWDRSVELTDVDPGLSPAA
ncbi:oxidoreductase [Aurantiacibacter spongiae]|uniref:SDR family NAD(P)-dependent oxidoreductase n=1 Tax=Aurantiacibacter spongiae TaxID=2488860 RepID=A0A3N5CXM1_9SPHN|nr:oxidoreductase [Aurantiacibacter spongiae]RPF72360.1 SDR family NAD(P)-dependent oxidoreductase [Aurantiacibacter spongiae]